MAQRRKIQLTGKSLDRAIEQWRCNHAPHLTHEEAITSLLQLGLRQATAGIYDPDKKRDYMREYMRKRYRQKQKVPQ